MKFDTINITPVPNKHIPVCPPGPAPGGDNTPPPSPESVPEIQQQSLLFPPDRFPKIDIGPLTIYKLDASLIASAIDHLARQPLPEASQVFPWLHGLHPQNHLQLAFFTQRRKSLRFTPQCLRGITIVKADGDLSTSRLKGAISAKEFMRPGTAEFLDIDPQEGFSVRNFQIQAAKVATVSDIIVYGEDEDLVRKLASEIAAAQVRRWESQAIHDYHNLPHYSTFICTSRFSEFEEDFEHLVAVNSLGKLTGNVLDFFVQERREMWAMAAATEISQNVWMGPTPSPGSDEERQYDVLIECTDFGRLNPDILATICQSKNMPKSPLHLEFPSSGSVLPPTWSQREADGILDTCKWLYHLSHGTVPSYSSTGRNGVDECQQVSCDGNLEGSDDDEDTVMTEDGDSEFKETGQAHFKILIHCADGYTELSMLSIAYFSYSMGIPIYDAWLQLHTVKKRNFFAYPTDVALLSAIASRLLHESPVCVHQSWSELKHVLDDEPHWMASLDGSLPSRILDYMYLGNLGHANNPGLLNAIGITQVLSVGEATSWPDGELEAWGEENICRVHSVQDNGIDPLTNEFERCLSFIERGRKNGTATLVHCRVGVSRSATICIAEVMRSLGLSFPRAYCFVRARRLNVIIQPHLRFVYELLKLEESLQQQTQKCIKRDLEWAEIAREIALMNKPYSR